jgi:glycosyltransferase involved in cell wall biosynthesis
MYPQSWPGADEFMDAGVAVRRLRMSNRRLGWIQDRYRLFREVGALAARGDIELVEAPDYQGWIAGWPGLAVPVLIRLSGSVTYFCDEMGRRSDRITRWLERQSLERADCWSSESHYLAGRTRTVFEIDRPTVPVIYNPVESPRDPGVRRDGNHVVFAGTLTEKKGIITLIRAWPLVIRECSQAVLHVYGKDTRRSDGSSMRDWLCSELAPAARGSVSFHGHVTVDELHEGFWKAAVAVLPSYAEGFALTPIHAMACGCTTICGNTSSGPELVEHGVNGLLVNPRDPGDVAAAIISALKDPERAGAIGRRAREHAVSRFSPDAVLALNEALYRNCLALSNRRQASPQAA